MTISTAVDVSAVARTVGIQVNYKDLRGGDIVYLPQRIAVIAQGATAATFSTTKTQLTSAAEVGAAYGYGSPLHLIATQLYPANGDGVGSVPVTFYPLDDATGSAAATGDVTPSGTQTEAAAHRVVVNNIQSQAFLIAAGDSVATVVAAMTAAINATLDIPVIATDDATKVTLTSKWKGASANDLNVSVSGISGGMAFAITQPTGGATNPDVQDALDQVGNVWETMFINAMNIADTGTLDKFKTFVDGRYGALTHKPCAAFTGNNAATVNDSILIPDARKLDKANVQIPAPGSLDLPFVTAARAVSRIAVVANNNPPQDYGSQTCEGLTPGTDGEQWDYAKQDQAVKAGSSTSTSEAGVVTLLDTVTFYHPDGDPTPAYRYVCDLVKLWNIIFNYNLAFNNTEWDGAPLVPSDQVTTNPSAKKPSDAIALAAGITDSLAENAIISDPDFAKENTFAEIDASNPKRLNLSTTVKLAGNNNITSIDINFGFYFG